MFCRISMQIRVHDVFAIRLFSFACHDTILYYDTTLTPSPMSRQIFANMAHMILPDEG
jgi:hypothetical protein